MPPIAKKFIDNLFPFEQRTFLKLNGSKLNLTDANDTSSEHGGKFAGGSDSTGDPTDANFDSSEMVNGFFG